MAQEIERLNSVLRNKVEELANNQAQNQMLLV